MQSHREWTGLVSVFSWLYINNIGDRYVCS
nr:MAG TPA: hypothetical protein [Bacteriophage sp.]